MRETPVWFLSDQMGVHRFSAKLGPHSLCLIEMGHWDNWDTKEISTRRLDKV